MNSKSFMQATLGAGRGLFHAPPSFTDSSDAPSERPLPVLVPIRALAARHRERIAQHLLALAPHDRYLRFGYAAQDAHIRRYVDGLDFGRDEIYGIFNRALVLIAVAHLALGRSGSDDTNVDRAEFGVSVNQDARGKGYGALLFQRAITHARNAGIDTLVIHALSENAAMLKIAANAGAWVERHGTESEAFLKLPSATLDSRFAEALEQQVAEVDFRMKWHAKRFWAFWADLRPMRQGGRQARRGSGS